MILYFNSAVYRTNYRNNAEANQYITQSLTFLLDCSVLSNFQSFLLAHIKTLFDSCEIFSKLKLKKAENTIKSK